MPFGENTTVEVLNPGDKKMGVKISLLSGGVISPFYDIWVNPHSKVVKELKEFNFQNYGDNTFSYLVVENDSGWDPLEVIGRCGDMSDRGFLLSGSEPKREWVIYYSGEGIFEEHLFICNPGSNKIDVKLHIYGEGEVSSNINVSSRSIEEVNLRDIVPDSFKGGGFILLSSDENFLSFSGYRTSSFILPTYFEARSLEGGKCVLPFVNVRGNELHIFNSGSEKGSVKIIERNRRGGLIGVKDFTLSGKGFLKYDVEGEGGDVYYEISGDGKPLYVYVENRGGELSNPLSRSVILMGDSLKWGYGDDLSGVVAVLNSGKRDIEVNIKGYKGGVFVGEKSEEIGPYSEYSRDINFLFGGEVDLVEVEGSGKSFSYLEYSAGNEKSFRWGFLWGRAENPKPEIDVIEPEYGYEGSSGVTLHIRGSGFISSGSVYLNGNSVSFNYLDDKHIDVELGSGYFSNSGRIEVKVSNPAPGGGDSNVKYFVVIGKDPVIKDLNPSEVEAGSVGRDIVVEGFSFTPDVKVYVDGDMVDTTFISYNQLRIYLPGSYFERGGEHSVMVRNGVTGGESNEVKLKVLNPVPAVSGVDFLNIGTGGVTFIIRGSGFIPSPDGSVVVSRHGELDTTFVSGSELRAFVPGSDVMPDGSVELWVRNPEPGGGESNHRYGSVPSDKLVHADAGGSLTVYEGDVVNLNGNNSTGPIESYRWEEFRGTPVDLSDSDSSVSSFTAPICEDGTILVFKLTVTGPVNSSVAMTSVMVKKRPADFTVVIDEPQDNSVLHHSKVTVRGHLEGNFDVNYTSILINGVWCKLNGDGSFSKELGLYDGYNLIEVKGYENVSDTERQKVSDARVSVNVDMDSPPVGDGESFVMGYVYEEGSRLPIEGVRVSENGVDGVVYTDSNGKFRYPVKVDEDLSGRNVTLTFMKDGYTFGQRNVYVRKGGEVYLEEDVYLLRLDGSNTEITPSGGVATNSDGSIKIEFPSGSVDENVNVNITKVVSGRSLPNELPKPSVFTYAFYFNNDRELELNKPARVLVLNTLGFPPGMEIPVGSYTKSTHRWVDAGKCRVTDDGMYLEYFTRHFSSFDLNDVGTPPASAGSSGGSPDNGNGVGGSCDSGSDGGNSRVSLSTGDLGIRYDLVGYRVLGSEFHITLNYSTRRLRPFFYIGYSEDNSNTAKPDYIDVDCVIGGRKFKGIFSPDKPKPGFLMRFSKEGMEEGYYDFSGTISNVYKENYHWTTDCFACPRQYQTGLGIMDPIVNRAKVRGRIKIERGSRSYGAGWDINFPNRFKLYKVKGTNRIIVEKEGEKLAELEGGCFERISGTSFYNEQCQGHFGNQEGVQFDGTQSISDYRMDSYFNFSVRNGVVYYFENGDRILKFGRDGKIWPVICNYSSDIKYDDLEEVLDYAFINEVGSCRDIQNFIVDKNMGLYLLTFGDDIVYIYPSGLIDKKIFSGPISGCNQDFIITSWDKNLIDLFDGRSKDYFFKYLNCIRIENLYNEFCVSTKSGYVDNMGNLYLLIYYGKGNCFYPVENRCALVRISDPLHNGIVRFIFDCSVDGGNTGDGGSVLNANVVPILNLTYDVRSNMKVDGKGNIYLLCTDECPGCHVDGCYPLGSGPRYFIRKIDTNWTIDTVVGGGDPEKWQWKLAKDGDDAKDVVFSYRLPETIMDFDVDNDGNIYIMTKYNLREPEYCNYIDWGSRILKVGKDGKIRVVAWTRNKGDYCNVQGSLVVPRIADNRYFTEDIWHGTFRGIAVDRDTGELYLAALNSPWCYSCYYNGSYSNLYIYRGTRFYESSDTRYTYDATTHIFKDTFTGEEVKFDERGNMIYYRDRNGNEERCEYDSDGKLLKVIDPLGNETVLEYGSNGKLERIVDPQGRVTFLDVDGNGDLVSIRGPEGSEVNFEYDSKHRLIKKVMPDGSEFLYDFDDELWYVKSIGSPNGEVRSYFPVYPLGSVDIGHTIYDENNMAPVLNGDEMVSMKVDGLGKEWVYGFNLNGEVTFLSDPDNVSRYFERDSSGRIVKETLPTGEVKEYFYDGKGRLVEEKSSIYGVTKKLWYDMDDPYPYMEDSFGKERDFYYDDRWNLTKVVEADGSVWRNYYDSKGLLTRRVDPLGEEWRYEYDGMGNLIRVTDPENRVTEYERDSAGNVTEVTDNLGNSKRYGYDNLNRKVWYRDESGNEWDYEYGCFGGGGGCGCSGSGSKVVSVKDPSGNETKFYYDGVGELIKRVNSDGSFVSYEYNFNREMVKVVDEDGYETRIEYDSGGRRKKVIYSDGRYENYFYDEAGLLVRKEDSAGRETLYSYDGAGRLVGIENSDGSEVGIVYDSTFPDLRSEVIDGMGNERHYEYDSMGRLTKEVDSLGRERKYEYDRLGRLVKITERDGSEIEMSYYGDGRIKERDFSDGSKIKYHYDGAGRLVRIEGRDVTLTYSYDERGLLTGITNETYGLGVTYQYDELGRKVSITYPDGGIINYTRNDRGSVVNLSEGGVSVSYSYTAGGRLTGASYSNGMEMGMSYDSGGRLIDKVYSGNGSVISDFTYSYYEDTGNIKSKTISDLGEIDYSYDSMNRLTGATYSWRDGESFSYDYNGNRTGSNLYDMWNYDEANELLGYGNGGSPIANLTYNDNGSVISYTKNGNSFEFKYTPLERIEEVDLNGNLLSKYYYDPLGERVKKEIYSNGALSNSIIYFYGQEGLLAEYDDSGNLIKKYIYNPDRPWGTDPLWQEDSSGNHYFYINDHLFTPQKMVDDGFNVVWQADWQSFGSVNEIVNSVENNLRFPGQYYDSETGFYYNFHRYYEPDVGRYLREDPVESGINFYVYVGDEPVKNIDPEGLDIADRYGLWPKECKKPNWCRCEKERKHWYENCVNKCIAKYHSQNHDGGYLPLLIELLSILIKDTPYGKVGQGISLCITVAGWFHGKISSQSFLNKAAGFIDYSIWKLGCRYWCNDILNNICFSDRWMEYGRSQIGRFGIHY